MRPVAAKSESGKVLGERDGGGTTAGVSLNPEEARQTLTEQVKAQTTALETRAPDVRSIEGLHVPCRCGRPLVGLEFQLITDTSGQFSLWATGYCVFGDGFQQVMYVGEFVVQPDTEQKKRIQREVETMVAEVERLRAGQEVGTATEEAKVA